MFQPKGTLTELFDLMKNRIIWKLRLENLSRTVRDYYTKDIKLVFNCPNSSIGHIFYLNDPSCLNDKIIKKFVDLLRQYYQDKFDTYNQRVEESRKELVRIAVLAGEHTDLKKKQKGKQDK